LARLRSEAERNRGFHKKTLKDRVLWPPGWRSFTGRMISRGNGAVRTARVRGKDQTRREGLRDVSWNGKCSEVGDYLDGTRFYRRIRRKKMGEAVRLDIASSQQTPLAKTRKSLAEQLRRRSCKHNRRCLGPKIARCRWRCISLSPAHLPSVCFLIS